MGRCNRSNPSFLFFYGDLFARIFLFQLRFRLCEEFGFQPLKLFPVNIIPSRKSKGNLVIVHIYHDHLIERRRKVFGNGRLVPSVFARRQELNHIGNDFRTVLFLALIVGIDVHIKTPMYVDEIADGEPIFAGIRDCAPCLHAKIVDRIVSFLVFFEALTNGNRKMNDGVSARRFVIAQLCCNTPTEDDAVHLNFLPFNAGRFGAVSGFPFLSGKVFLHSG